MVALLMCIGIVSGSPFLSFVGGAPSRLRVTGTRSSGLRAFPWESQSSAEAERAYAGWASAYPIPAQTGQYLGTICDKNSIIQRFDALGQIFGKDIASSLVEKEPMLLMQSTTSVRNSLEYLKGLEAPDQTGEAVSILQKNPKLLTVSPLEFSRTKTSLSSLASSASVIDFLRPAGPLGLAFFIFGSFIALIIVLRPILYGINGGPSLLSAVSQFVTGGLPGIPNPREFLESNGISPPLLVALIPIYQVLSIFAKKAEAQSGKE